MHCDGVTPYVRTPSVTTGTKLVVAEATLILPVIDLALVTDEWNALHQRFRFELEIIIPNSQKRKSCKKHHSRVEIGSKYYIAD